MNTDANEAPMIQVQPWPVADLVPYPQNPRKNDHAVQKMIAAILEFGFVIPLLIRSTGDIVDGHLRLKAAIKLELKTVPVILVDHWSQEQVQAARLLFNRSSSWATFDLELVSVIMNELAEVNFDLCKTGFDGIEIDGFLSGVGNIDAHVDSVPDPPLDPVTVPGDLWHCGAHRVLCGDATSADAASRLLESAKPFLMVTDPPYSVGYSPLWREQAGLGRARQTGTVTNDDRLDWTEAYRLFPGDAAYIWHAGVHSGDVAQTIEQAGWDIRSQIIWMKPHFVLSRGDYHWGHEPAYYAIRRGKTSHWRGDRKQSTVWQIANMNPFGGDRTEMPTGHGTQKPVELMRRPILNHLERGEGVYDPFLGSGTTLMAAELTGRICYGLEIEPRWVDTIVCRWQDLTGEMAVLDSTDRTFKQIQDERQRIPEMNSDIEITES
jgi:DNA modification methylase